MVDEVKLCEGLFRDKPPKSVAAFCGESELAVVDETSKETDELGETERRLSGKV